MLSQIACTRFLARSTRSSLRVTATISAALSPPEPESPRPRHHPAPRIGAHLPQLRIMKPDRCRVALPTTRVTLRSAGRVSHILDCRHYRDDCDDSGDDQNRDDESRFARPSDSIVTPVPPHHPVPNSSGRDSRVLPIVRSPFNRSPRPRCNLVARLRIGKGSGPGDWRHGASRLIRARRLVQARTRIWRPDRAARTWLPSSILPAFVSRSLGRFSIAPTGPLKLKVPST